MSIEITGVQNRGVGGEERIAMRAMDGCQTGNLWLGIGVQQTENSVFPINNNMFWLGHGILKKGDWIFLYTGHGEPRKLDVPGEEYSIYSIYWKRDEVLFSANEIYPYLLVADSVVLSNDMRNTLSLPNDLFGR